MRAHPPNELKGKGLSIHPVGCTFHSGSIGELAGLPAEAEQDVTAAAALSLVLTVLLFCFIAVVKNYHFDRVRVHLEATSAFPFPKSGF